VDYVPRQIDQREYQYQVSKHSVSIALFRGCNANSSCCQAAQKTLLYNGHNMPCIEAWLGVVGRW